MPSASVKPRYQRPPTESSRRRYLFRSVHPSDRMAHDLLTLYGRILSRTEAKAMAENVGREGDHVFGDHELASAQERAGLRAIDQLQNRAHGGAVDHVVD